MKLKILAHDCVAPKVYREPLGRGDRAMWLDRLGELVDTMSGLDRLVIIRRDTAGLLYCSTVPEELEVE